MKTRMDDEKRNLFRSALDELCRFRIGDQVLAAGSADDLASELKDLPPDPYLDPGSLQTWSVVERHVQECYGGIQVHYDVRHLDRSGHFVVGRFTEPELESAEEAGRIHAGYRAAWLQEKQARKR